MVALNLGNSLDEGSLIQPVLASSATTPASK
jgi:hypothetical protein